MASMAADAGADDRLEIGYFRKYPNKKVKRN